MESTIIQPVSRRGLLKGIGLLIAAPAIIKVAGIMPIKALPIEAVPAELTQSAVEEMLDEIMASRARNHASRLIIWPGLKTWWNEAYDRIEQRAISAEEFYVEQLDYPFTIPNYASRIT